MFLATQTGEFLIIAISGVIVIAVALLVYFIASNKSKKTQAKVENNSETKNLEINNEVNTLDVSNEVNQVVNEQPKDVLWQPHENIEQPKEEKVISELTPEQKEEEEKTDSSIQTLLEQMQSDLNNKADYQESINRYEDDEEANAIISYRELMKYKESHEKDIVLEDKGKEEIKEVIKENKEEPVEEVKKFKRSEFISPIFGYNDDTNVTYREIKRPPRKEVKMPVSETEWESDRMLKDLEDSSAEVIDFSDNKKEEIAEDENDKFLDALVDFRKNLD